MLKLFVAFTFLLHIGTVHLEEKFDPTKIDYCKIHCGKKKFAHTGCSCKLKEPREELALSTFPIFREEILEIHNGIRERVASGKDKETNPANKFAPAASNMLAMKYDMEMEYIARCFSRNSLVHENDKCRVTAEGEKKVGQNAGFVGGRDEMYHQVTIEGWYNQVEALGPTTIEAYNKEKTPGPTHLFAQVVWALTDSIGCARSYYPDHKMSTRLICNYVNRRGNKSAESLAKGQPVYLKGDPCTACPFDTKCDSNSRYPSLCGEIVAPPQEAPYDFSAIDGSGTGSGSGSGSNRIDRIGGDKTVVIFTLFVVMLLH